MSKYLIILFLFSFYTCLAGEQEGEQIENSHQWLYMLAIYLTCILQVIQKIGKNSKRRKEKKLKTLLQKNYLMELMRKNKNLSKIKTQDKPLSSKKKEIPEIKNEIPKGKFKGLSLEQEDEDESLAKIESVYLEERSEILFKYGRIIYPLIWIAIVAAECVAVWQTMKKDQAGEGQGEVESQLATLYTNQEKTKAPYYWQAYGAVFANIFSGILMSSATDVKDWVKGKCSDEKEGEIQATIDANNRVTTESQIRGKAYLLEPAEGLQTAMVVWVTVQVMASVFTTVHAMVDMHLKLSHLSGWTQYNLMLLPLLDNTALRAGWALVFAAFILMEITKKNIQVPIADGITEGFKILLTPYHRGHLKWLNLTVALQSMILNMLLLIPQIVTHTIPAALVFCPLVIGTGLMVAILKKMGDQINEKDEWSTKRDIAQFFIIILGFCLIYWLFLTLNTQMAYFQAFGNDWTGSFTAVWHARTMESQISNLESSGVHKLTILWDLVGL